MRGPRPPPRSAHGGRDKAGPQSLGVKQAGPGTLSGHGAPRTPDGARAPARVVRTREFSAWARTLDPEQRARVQGAIAHVERRPDPGRPHVDVVHGSQLPSSRRPGSVAACGCCSPSIRAGALSCCSAATRRGSGTAGIRSRSSAPSGCTPPTSAETEGSRHRTGAAQTGPAHRPAHHPGGAGERDARRALPPADGGPGADRRTRSTPRHQRRADRPRSTPPTSSSPTTSAARTSTCQRSSTTWPRSAAGSRSAPCSVTRRSWCAARRGVDLRH